MYNHTFGNPFRFSELLGFGFAKLHIYTMTLFFLFSFCLFCSSVFSGIYGCVVTVHTISVLPLAHFGLAGTMNFRNQSMAYNLNSSSVICKRITCKMIFNFCLIIENRTECCRQMIQFFFTFSETDILFRSHFIMYDIQRDISGDMDRKVYS